VTRRANIDEARFRELWAAGVGVLELGELFGCSGAAVSYRAQRLGLPSRTVSAGRLPQRAIVRAYESGASIGRIAEGLRKQFPTLADSTVKRILHSLGVKVRSRGSRRMQKVTECVRLVGAGVECAVAAKRLGLTRLQVARRARSVLGPLPGGRRPRLPVKAIVSRVRAGESQSSVARSLRCSQGTVAYHVARARAKQTTKGAAACTAAGEGT
jgi:hypothetical protein